MAWKHCILLWIWKSWKTSPEKGPGLTDFQKASKGENEQSKVEAIRLDNILQPIHNSMFVESNPSPVKYAAKLLDLCDDEVRLPLIKVTEPTKDIIKKALVSANLL